MMPKQKTVIRIGACLAPFGPISARHNPRVCLQGKVNVTKDIPRSSRRTEIFSNWIDGALIGVCCTGDIFRNFNNAVFGQKIGQRWQVDRVVNQSLCRSLFPRWHSVQIKCGLMPFTWMTTGNIGILRSVDGLDLFYKKSRVLR